MSTKLYWVDGPWLGKLAMSARPRGGDWLQDEISHWQLSGVDTVLSLLEAGEEQDLDLGGEGFEVSSKGIRFRSFPIADRDVPGSRNDMARLVDELDRELDAGRNVVLHCRQGVGRTGLVAACLFLARGFTPEAAVARLSEARGVAVPETAGQLRWLEHFAETLALAR